jgi:hypothetical protein
MFNDMEEVCIDDIPGETHGRKATIFGASN